MPEKLSPRDINATIWKACDTFRGAVDASQYKDYILTMLFLKYLSDLWKEKRRHHEKEYKGDQKRVERELKYERFRVPEESTFDYLYAHRNRDTVEVKVDGVVCEKSLGELINRALEKLEEANGKKLEGVFRNIDFNNEASLGRTPERNERLRHLLNDFASLDLQSSHLEGRDVIGDAYEFLIAHFADSAGKKAGEFYTPSEVSRLLAKLVDPQPGDRICDPACGSGSLLIRAAREVGRTNYSLYGQEINGNTWALARMNMFLHEEDAAAIYWGDTLKSPQAKEGDELMKFHVVVANPPFSLDKWGHEGASSDRFNRYHRGIPPKSRGDYAFITHMIETAREDVGRVGVIVPHGVLFRGSSEGRIRKALIEENLLEAVVGLPAKLFFGTGIPAAILVFNKGKGENTDVLFIDASREYEAGKNQNRLREQDIDHILGVYKAFKAAEPLTAEEGSVLEDKYAYRATLKEIQENDYNLNIPRYVDTFEEEELVDIPATQEEILRLKSELAQVEDKMAQYLKELGF